MKPIMGLLATVVVLAVAIAAYVWSGSYNVAATAPHWEMTVRLMTLVRDRSVAVHSEGITVPSSNNPKLHEIGFEHYHAMCRLCHGAPGYSSSETGKGLNPTPPSLASLAVQKLTDAELYWVIVNGIKMTGMPAFGPTHDDEELLGIQTFLRRLPNLKPEEYDLMVGQSGLMEGNENPHDHGHGHEDHHHQ